MFEVNDCTLCDFKTLCKYKVKTSKESCCFFKRLTKVINDQQTTVANVTAWLLLP